MSTKRKASAVRFAAPSVKTAINVPNKTKIDETRTSISSAGIEANAANVETIEISSDEASDSDDEDEVMDGVETTTQPTETTTAVAETAALKANGVPHKADASTEDDSEDGASPSFGELLRGTIDVPALLSQNPDGTLVPLTKTTDLAAPSLDSLGTVLTQALRTEDTELLESCLQVTATDAVQQTVSRLDSALAGVLLTKLAARFHRRPGRAGSLMAWVKWTLVAHGGALAIQPGVLDRLTSLQRVLNERSRGLPSLLALKGKLDMLDAQMQLRAARQRRTTATVPGVDQDEQESSDDEDDAIYVEGEEAHGGAGDSADELEDEVALATSRGFAADSDVDDDLDDVEEIGDSEADEDDLDEDDVDHDDLDDSASDDDSDAEAAPPSKVQKTARTAGKRR